MIHIQKTQRNKWSKLVTASRFLAPRPTVYETGGRALQWSQRFLGSVLTFKRLQGSDPNVALGKWISRSWHNWIEKLFSSIFLRGTLMQKLAKALLCLWTHLLRHWRCWHFWLLAPASHSPTSHQTRLLRTWWRPADGKPHFQKRIAVIQTIYDIDIFVHRII